jgi:hypothetical protein
MSLNGERPAVEWFEEAVRCYAEEHQGCASCGERHCVFRSWCGQRVDYYCHACDFSVCHDVVTGNYFAALGEGRRLPDAILDSAALFGRERAG